MACNQILLGLSMLGFTRLACVLAVFCLPAVIIAAPTPGAFDPTYGQGGIGGGWTARHLARLISLQPNGDVYTVDECSTVGFCASKYFSNGQVDWAWGATTSLGGVPFGGGNAQYEVAKHYAKANSILVLPDATVLLAGTCTHLTNRITRYCLTKLNEYGYTDYTNTFGTQGFAFYDEAGNSEFETSMTLADNGYIYLSGSCKQPNQQFNFCLRRIRLDTGALDTSFATGGLLSVSPPFSNIRQYASQILSKPDGGVLLLGSCENLPGQDICVLQLTANGQVDTSYGNLGWAVASVYPYIPFWQRAVIDNRGRLVIGATCYDYTSYDKHCATRISAQGVQDVTYGNSGTGYTFLPIPHNYFLPSDVALQSDGRLLMIGNCNYVLHISCLMRLTANGLPDESMGPGGVLSLQFATTPLLHALAVQPDGKILLGGSIGNRHSVVRIFSGDLPEKVPLSGGLNGLMLVIILLVAQWKYRKA
jgi:uncharacterized delta-60 repeat protein